MVTRVKKVVGGACLQCDHTVFKPITKVHPLRFFGHKLTLVEQEKSVIERELLALLVGYKSSLHFLNGRHVTLQRSEKSIIIVVVVERLLNQLADVSFEIPGWLRTKAELYLANGIF